MTTAAPILHSLEILEKEFEKAYVDLDVLVTDYENFEFCDDHIETVQTLMKTMSLCFSQLCYKTQMTAISNAKLEVTILILNKYKIFAPYWTIIKYFYPLFFFFIR